jgi:peptidoglycan/LPS O-acetylase OafA/YrhL
VTAPAPERIRIPQLDLLRSIAVLLVIAQHSEGSVLQHQMGWTGVDLFFVLSGFLVSGLLFSEHQRNGQVNAVRFLIRRGLKIYPGFWLMIAITSVALTLTEGRPPRLVAVACELLFLQNYGPGLFAHTWSLAVEEHFYLLTASLFWWRSRRAFPGTRRTLEFLGSFILLITLSRFGSQLLIPLRFKASVWGTHVRLDSLLFGALLAYLHHFHHAALSSFVVRWRRWLVVASVVLLTTVFVTPQAHIYVRTLGFTALYLGYGAIMVLALYVWRFDGQVSKALAFVGRHSYGIYLWHVPFGTLLLSPVMQKLQLPQDAWLNYVYLAVPSIAIGVAMSKLVERPSLAFRARYFPPI